jgi:hypothetical protein
MKSCNYPDCDGGPATGKCHVDCHIAALDEDDQQRLEAAEAVGFVVIGPNVVLCSVASLLMYARAAENNGRAQAANMATAQRNGLGPDRETARETLDRLIADIHARNVDETVELLQAMRKGYDPGEEGDGGGSNDELRYRQDDAATDHKSD